MCVVISGHALLAFMRIASACTNCSATRDCLDANLSIQLIDGVLSPSSDIDFSFKSPPTSSITIHANSIPAISRSELVILPLGFVRDFTSFVMSSGHCHRKTVGIHLDPSPNTTPPTPWLDASTMPTKSGQPLVSSRQRVGSLNDSRSRVLHALIACKRRSFLCRYTRGGAARRIRLTGDRNATPCGVHVNACLIFAVTDLNSSNAIPFRPLFAARIHPVSIVINFSLFASSSHIVLLTPSNINPSKTFRVSNSQSFCFSFFSDTGSSLSLSLAGNTSWIPVMIAVPTCSSWFRDTGITIPIKSSTYTSTM